MNKVIPTMLVVVIILLASCGQPTKERNLDRLRNAITFCANIHEYSSKCVEATFALNKWDKFHVTYFFVERPQAYYHMEP